MVARCATTLGILLAALGPAQARAQDDAPEGVPLSSGFTPDPLRLEGRTAGLLPLSAHAPGCRGYVGERPDHVLRLETGFVFLRLFVTARDDVTLAVRGPDGSVRCAGRPLLGAPREQGAFEAGRYEVWVGSVRPATEVPHELHVTEFRSVTPARTIEPLAAAGGRTEIGLAVNDPTGRFRGRRLRRGFLPDPQEDGGVAGGSIEATPLGSGCRGRLEAQPSHVLVLRDELDYMRIYTVESEAPVTLVVRTPAGAYLCSAPDEASPSIERDAWPPGQYRIWVGSRTAEATPRYRIAYTEMRAASD